MLEKDPAKRCNIIAVAQSPWLTRNDGDPIDLDLSSIGSKDVAIDSEIDSEEQKHH